MNNAFYELKHEIGADYFTVERNQDFSFPLHMHRCFEIILLLDGSMTVTVEKKEYVLNAGDMIFVKPNFIHSLKTSDTSRHVLCIFAPELIAAISDELIKYLLISPVIKNVPELYRQLFEKANENMDIGGVKGFLYTVSDLFYKQLDFSKEDTATRKKHLLQKILLYVDENMGQPCAITDLAKHLDYAPSYLSRFFYTNIGMPYSDYVRNIKISHACYLLRNTRESVIDIAIQCGYFSISSFNRNFKQMTSYSPTEYRKKNNHMKKESK
ncbi:MAG: helix-turn-helix transcriptional regulator [Clostridia bacterium]|nr:helix-turn-helix transcriptional regulator [Clostridia bacterium]